MIFRKSGPSSSSPVVFSYCEVVDEHFHCSLNLADHRAWAAATLVPLPAASQHVGYTAISSKFRMVSVFFTCCTHNYTHCSMDTSTNWRQSLLCCCTASMEQATDGAETAAIDGLVSSWSENISVSFCLRAPGYGLTLWCALSLLVGDTIQVPQLQLQLLDNTQSSRNLLERWSLLTHSHLLARVIFHFPDIQIISELIQKYLLLWFWHFAHCMACDKFVL